MKIVRDAFVNGKYEPFAVIPDDQSLFKTTPEEQAAFDLRVAEAKGRSGAILPLPIVMSPFLPEGMVAIVRGGDSPPILYDLRTGTASEMLTAEPTKTGAS